LVYGKSYQQVTLFPDILERDFWLFLMDITDIRAEALLEKEQKVSAEENSFER